MDWVMLTSALCTGRNSTMRLTVHASGGPYGRVLWESERYITSRPSQTANITTLYLSRTEGSRGRLRIFYRYLFKMYLKFKSSDISLLVNTAIVTDNCIHFCLGSSLHLSWLDCTLWVARYHSGKVSV